MTYQERKRKDFSMPDISVVGAYASSSADPYARLRTPGEIQAFGVLLALHPVTLRVLSASENVDSELGIAHASILGWPLHDMIEDADVLAHIKERAGDETPVFDNPMLVTVRGRRFDLVLHSNGGVLIAELVILAPGAATRADMDRLSNAAIIGMVIPDTVDQLLEAGANAIHQTTEFDRVLLYRFDEANRGQVVAEARRPGVESFMGLFFPESDIGAPVRQLYKENLCRYIPDIHGPVSRVLPAENPLTCKPLDMSQSILRGVSPCHISYLSNMGVTASLSFSIVSEGRLWGLFACHHYRERRLSYTERMVCEQIAMMFVAKLNELLCPAAMEEEMQARREALLKSSPLCNANPLQQEWTAEDEQAALALVNAEGAAIYIDGKVGEIGSCPNLAELHEFIENRPEDFDRLLRMYDEDGLFYTSTIAAVLPFGERMREQGSGLMVIPLARGRREFLLWFRPEVVLKATWAGNPSETIKDPSARSSPRTSFAAWKEDIRDRSAPWTLLDIANAKALRSHVLGLGN